MLTESRNLGARWLNRGTLHLVRSRTRLLGPFDPITFSRVDRGPLPDPHAAALIARKHLLAGR